jgi:pectinesterase
MIRIVFISILVAINVDCLSQNIDFVVAKDGSGDYTSVQDAINEVPHLRKNRTTILIKSGVYKEKLIIPSTKTNISILGEDAEKTIITYGDGASTLNQFGEEIGTSGSSSVFIFGSGFVAKDITFENSFGVGSQAVAVRVDADRVKFERCRFLGNQDTLYPHGDRSRQYYKDCYIEGTVDFIFGWSNAFFDHCEIFCKDAGFITAASTPQESAFGFTFYNCMITGSAEPASVYLGRPWRPYAKTIFIECQMSEVVKAEGWDPWGSEDKKKTAFYAEYNNSGIGADLNGRVEWSKVLTPKQAEIYSLENVMGDWNPLID